MTTFEVKIYCTATVFDDRTQTQKGGHCHKVVSGECARDTVKTLINKAAEAAGTQWQGYHEGPMYSHHGTCYLRNGDLNGLTEQHPTRERRCGHVAAGTVIINKPESALVQKLHQIGFSRQS